MGIKLVKMLDLEPRVRNKGTLHASFGLQESPERQINRLEIIPWGLYALCDTA
jgi:hypothetical protein